MKKCRVCGRNFEPPETEKLCCSRKCTYIYNNCKYFLPCAPVEKSLTDWQREAQSCGMSYGKYRTAINQGKTFEELKNSYESNRIEE